jgi:hypothetical protein
MFPKIVITGSDAPAAVLARVPLASGERNEAWLRDFLLRHPEALPAADIDPAFADPVPVCRELSTPAGPIDALFVNRAGAITVVECKLWRNPQARREVVGQILDYAKELARWRYEDLQREVSRARREPGNALFRLVAERHEGLDEARFVDAVGRNLRAGRFLLLVAGDGIREGTEAIVRFMQDYSGMRFTFGLVEMAGYELPDGRLLVQPRLLARTVALEREVVRVVDRGAAGGMEAVAEDAEEDAEEEGSATGRPTMLSDPAAIAADRAFWDRFASILRLDDPSQPPPRRRGFGHARLELGVREAWISVFRTRRLRWIGVSVIVPATLSEQVFGAPDSEARARLQDSVLASLGPGTSFRWGQDARSEWFTAYLPEQFEPAEQADARHLAWLTVATNAFVNVFRPRVLRAAEGGEQGV